MLLAGRELHYRVVRSARRSVGLKIDAGGLTLQLPWHFPSADVRRVLQDKQAWIFAKLDHWQQLQVLPQPSPLALQIGEDPIDWLGVPHRVLTGASRSFVSDGTIHLNSTTPESRAPALARLMQREARLLLFPRLTHWATQLGLAPERVQLSGARSRWGSCTSQRSIRLNWRLMQAPLNLIDYVIIHELCHLAEMNHSPRFWALVAHACPHWKDCRKQLRQRSPRYFAW